MKKKQPELLRKLLAINAELKLREKEQAAENFIPNGKQEEFAWMVGQNETFINLFIAANGVGKSCIGAMIVRSICFGSPNKYFDQPLYNDFPYLKKGRIISDPTTLKEKIVPELKKWFPSNRYEIKYKATKAGKNYEAKWTTDTGFEFDLMSNEQDPKEFESVDLGWEWFDEPSKKSIYLASIARLRRGGILFWTLTPLSYSAWIKDELYDKRDGKTIDYVNADVEDNCIQHGKRGMLEHDNIEKMLSQYPEAELEARAKGKFGHLLGLVHKGFEPKIHVIDPFTINPEDFTVYQALDTHPRVPDASLWMAVDAKGDLLIIDENSFSGTDEEYSVLVKRKELMWNMGGRLIDPSAFNDDKRTTERPFADRLADHELHYMRGSKDLIGCINVTDEAFKYQMVEGRMVVAPKVFIFSNCQGLIKELQHYIWDEYVGKGADEKDPKPHPKDKDDHFVECLHRLIMEKNFTHRPPVIAKKQNIGMKKYQNRDPNKMKSVY